MMKTDRTLDAYSEIAPVYAEYAQGRKAYLDTVDGLVISHLKPDMRLLDIGAGDGHRLAKIQAETGISDIIAVEPSPGMVKICAAQTGVPVHEICAENLDELSIGKFDSIIALWNVFGHIPSSEARLKALNNMRNKLNEGGQIILDVNNRHNAASYGRLKVLGRVVVDALCYDEKRGDASYEWKIGDQVFQASGHLFTPAEIEGLFRKANLKIVKRLSVNYADGTVSQSPYRGQLFYILGK